MNGRTREGPSNAEANEDLRGTEICQTQQQYNDALQQFHKEGKPLAAIMLAADTSMAYGSDILQPLFQRPQTVWGL